MRHVFRTAFVSCVLPFVLFLVLAHSQAKADGTICFTKERITAQAGSNELHIPIALVSRGANGIAGLQFRIVRSTQSIQFRTILRGTFVANTAAWSLDYYVLPTGDTISVVLWSCNGGALPEGSYDEIVCLDVSYLSQTDGQLALRLVDVASVLEGGQGNTGNIGIGSPTSVIISMEPTKKAWLNQNFPNPYNPSTVIRFSVPESGPVSLKIYNPLGQEVAILAEHIMEKGDHDVSLNASNLSSGMYFYCLSGMGFNEVRTMTLVK